MAADVDVAGARVGGDQGGEDLHGGGLAGAVRAEEGEKVFSAGVELPPPDGTIFSLLGPNGAGKPTAVKILSTLVSADAGTGDIHVGGHDLAADPQA
ncbi:ATP-binding cassette domain-containing protein, partial [Streptomyces viridochromogenes]|uniref:ATP-binding cassette domain-containing protein n=1 Tax=Streptomyces viridochromogenes TaxID=1938 RepID=UPI001F32CD70